MLVEGVVVVLVIFAFDGVVIAFGKQLQKLNAWLNKSTKNNQ